MKVDEIKSALLNASRDDRVPLSPRSTPGLALPSEVPSVAEAGVPGLENGSIPAIVVWHGTGAECTRMINSEMAR